MVMHGIAGISCGHAWPGMNKLWSRMADRNKLWSRMAWQE